METALCKGWLGKKGVYWECRKAFRNDDALWICRLLCMINIEVQVCQDRHGKSRKISVHAADGRYGISMIFMVYKARVRAIIFALEKVLSQLVPSFIPKRSYALHDAAFSQHCSFVKYNADGSNRVQPLAASGIADLSRRRKETTIVFVPGHPWSHGRGDRCSPRTQVLGAEIVSRLDNRQSWIRIAAVGLFYFGVLRGALVEVSTRLSTRKRGLLNRKIYWKSSGRFIFYGCGSPYISWWLRSNKRNASKHVTRSIILDGLIHIWLKGDEVIPTSIR